MTEDKFGTKTPLLRKRADKKELDTIIICYISPERNIIYGYDINDMPHRVANKFIPFTINEIVTDNKKRKLKITGPVTNEQVTVEEMNFSGSQTLREEKFDLKDLKSKKIPLKAGTYKCRKCEFHGADNKVFKVIEPFEFVSPFPIKK
jgi:hypothetical protein